MNIKIKFPRITTLGLVTLLMVFSCKKEPNPVYDVPTTYNFANVNFSGQTTRLDMLGEMVTLMKTGNTQGTSVAAQALKNMYGNVNAPFSDQALNAATTKQLKNKTFSLDATLIESYMDSLALASQSQVAGSNGTAGVVTSGTSSYLFDRNGREYTQLIEKGLMGACFYYQITSVYFGEDEIGSAVDNTTVVAGEGTDMEHHWDEAFGYFGVPLDFPTNKTGIRYIGKYCDSRDGVLGLNKFIMDAYLKGRAAISNKDMDTKDEQIEVLREKLELVFAGTAIHYLNGAMADFSDDALRNHQLSEAWAFIGGLKYNPSRKITETQIATIRSLIGDNFYNSSLVDLTSARDQISTIFSLDDQKATL